jgi:hypothetical protein
MPRPRLLPRSTVSSTTAFLFLLAGCSPSGPGIAEDGTLNAVPTSSSSPTEPLTETASPEDARVFRIVDEPDTGCVATTSAPRVRLQTDGLLLTSLERVGERRIARDLGGRGGIVFGPGGTAPTVLELGDDGRITGSESGIVAAGLDADGHVVLRRYDPAGGALGAPSDLGGAALGRPFAVGRADATSLVVWAPRAGGVRARLVGPDGRDRDVVLEEGADFTDFSVAIARSSAADGSAFLVLWSLRRVALDAHRVYAALVGDKGIVGLPRVVLANDRPVSLVRAVAHAGGAIVLANLEHAPLVLSLDPLGRLSGPAHRFEGTLDANLGGAHDLTAVAGDAAFLADHASGSHVFRRLDLTGSPRDGWICLDAPQPDEFQLGGIVADEAGYSVVVAAPGGATDLLQLDATGRASGR